MEEKVEEKVVEIVMIEDEKEVEVINKSEKPMTVRGAKEEEKEEEKAEEKVEECKEEWKGHCHQRKF